MIIDLTAYKSNFNESALSKKYLIDVFVPGRSRGLMIDALVLQKTLGADKVRILTIPIQAYSAPLIENDKTLHLI